MNLLIRAVTRLRNRRLRSRIRHTKPLQRPDPDALHVRVLTNDDFATELLWTVKTLSYFSGRSVNLTIHDDGSVRSATIDMLNHHFPGCSIVRRREADSIMRHKLADYPACRRFRNAPGAAMSLKLFDCLAMADAPFIGLDTDIVFFSRPSDMIAYHDGHTPFFQYNGRNVYVASIDTLSTHFQMNVIPSLCAGMILGGPEILDLPLLEEYCQWSEQLDTSVGKREQTAWALLYSTLPSTPARLDARYGISSQTLDANTVCHHYTGPVRHRLWTED